MPLTKRLFQLAVDTEAESLMRQVYELLSGQNHLAFSEAELLDMTSSDINQLNQALEALAGIGAVEVRKIGTEYYYAFNREVDQATWEPR